MLAQDDKKIDELLKSSSEDVTCANEGEVDGHLGVEIRSENNRMTLKQPQLTKRVTQSLGLEDNNPKATPVIKPLLSKNTDGKDRSEDDFNCRSEIGSLMHLAGCTRPDTSIAVHQAAKFSNNPPEQECACNPIEVGLSKMAVVTTSNKKCAGP